MAECLHDDGLWMKIDKMTAKIESNSMTRSPFIKFLKSQNKRSLNYALVLRTLCEKLRLKAADISDDVVDLVHNIIDQIENAETYCLVQMEKLQLFSSKEAGERDIKSWKKRKEHGYYDGQFKCLVDNVYVYEFKHIKGASGAVRNDFKLTIDIVATSKNF